MNSLAVVLLRLVALLSSAGESGWSASLASLGVSVMEAPTEEERAEAINDLLGLYGGMGSLNDLVLQGENGVLPGNDELDRLRHLLHDEIVGLRLSG